MGRSATHGPVYAIANRVIFIALAAQFSLHAPNGEAAQTIRMHAARIESPQVDARDVRVMFAGSGPYRAEAFAGELRFAGQRWRDLRARCEALMMGLEVACPRGMLIDEPGLPFSLSYRRNDGRLLVSAQPDPKESWRLDARFLASSPYAALSVRNGALARFESLLPESAPKLQRGTFNADVKALSRARRFDQLRGTIDLAGLDFSDASGNRAGQKIAARLEIAVARAGEAWRWQTRLNWREGEVYWQPLYLTRLGDFLIAQGSADRNAIRIDKADLKLADAGQASLSAVCTFASKRCESLALRSETLDLARLYPIAIKPWAESKGLGDWNVAGRARVVLQMRDASLRALDLKLNDVRIENKKSRRSLDNLDLTLDWRDDAPGSGAFKFAGAQFGELPIGAVDGRIESDGWRFRVPTLPIPLFDGSLTLQNLVAEKTARGWTWRFEGGVTPISMERFSRAMKWPVMHGTIAAVIPEVSYRNQQVDVSGALLFNVFDGSVVVKNLKFIQPLGRVPRLLADIDMTRLDLDLLTRTFSFGSMEGRIDVKVANMELMNWRPVRFDASLASSAGDYKRSISQQAVQNISALGGAGPAAAIQRSFLRFFERFGYDRIGLSCVLRNAVCLMDGLEPAAQGQGYVIVKGGGIPAITVIGYNREVAWEELLERVRRITRDNVKPVIR